MEQIEIKDVAEGKEITVDGTLSVQDAAQLKDLLIEAGTGTDQIILDLSKLKAIDMACLQLLFALSRSFLNSDKKLTFRENISDAFSAALKSAGLNDFFSNQTIAAHTIWNMGEDNV